MLLEAGDGTVRLWNGAGAQIQRPFRPERELIPIVDADIASSRKRHSWLDWETAPGSWLRRLRRGRTGIDWWRAADRGPRTATGRRGRSCSRVLHTTVTFATSAQIRLTNSSDRRLYAARNDLSRFYRSTRCSPIGDSPTTGVGVADRC